MEWVRRAIRGLWGAVVLAAPGPILWIIARYGVNVPIQDQIDIGSFLVRNHGRFLPSITDLFAQHNESRKVFPRLLVFYLAKLTHWNVKYEMAMQVAIAFGTVIAIWVLARGLLGERALPATALSALLLLSPVQWWNWLFGIQLVVFIPMLMLAVALAAGTRRPVIGALCCFVATYSYANGMLLWFLVGVALFARREDRRPSLIAMWGAAAALSIGAYFIGYQRPPVSPKLISPFTHPFEAAQFVLAFLGHPLCWTDSLTPNVVIGLVGAILFIGLAFATKMNGLPFLLIGSYSLISACATALGRLGFGDWAALEPRYTAFALPMWVAIVMLAGMSLKSMRLAGAFALVVLHFLASYAVLPKIRESNRDRLISRTAVQFCRVMTAQPLFARLVYRDVPRGVAILTAVSKLGYLSPPLIESPVIQNAGPTKGELEGILRVGPRHWVIFGWALLPDGRPFDSVLITRDDRIVAISERTVGRNDRPGPGWDLPFTQRLANAGAIYNAYAYDTETRRAYRLAGALRLGTR